MKYKIEFIKTDEGKVWTLRCGQPGKLPLLVIHGGPGFPHNYLESLKELADEREVIFYDSLGCGSSERPDNGGYRNIEYFIREVNDVRTGLGLNKVVLLGHSFGAALACENAVEHPAGIKAVVFASPYLDTRIWMQGAEKNISTMPDEFKRQIDRHQKNRTTFSEEYGLLKEEYDRNFGLRIRPLPKEVEEANRGFDSETYRTLWGDSEFNCNGTLVKYSAPVDQMPKIPVIFTCGKFDSAKEEFLQGLANKIPGSEVVVFEKSSHMPHIEQKEEYLKVIRKFFNDNGI